MFLTVILACLRQAHGQNSLYPKLVGFRESLGIPRCRSVTIRLGQGDIICEMCDEMGATLAANSDLSPARSEEHTSELQSLMRISSAVFCLQKKNTTK